MNSGDSEASGATHCTSTNSSMPALLPVSTRPSANGSAAAKITAAAKTKMREHQRSRGRPRQRADRGGRPDELALLLRRRLRDAMYMYAAKSENMTAVSMSERWPRMGIEKL